MSTPTLLPQIAGIEIISVTTTAGGIELRLVTNAPYVACPCCGQSTQRVHSRYQRTVADLPWNRVAVRIQLLSRKLFCDNPDCPKTIFTEPLPQLVARYARKTLPLQEALYLVGYALGGRPGARIAVELGLVASHETLLRRIRQQASQQASQQAVPLQDRHALGIDDFAFRKGHHYGTILVDLERHRLVDLLPDRCSESVAQWLKSQPNIQIISRDRATCYADGATEGAPQASQIADRWHLLRNLGEVMERLTAQHSAVFRSVAEQIQHGPNTSPTPDSAMKVSPAEQRRLDHCVKRETLYRQVKTLRSQGCSLSWIASQTGISLRTVQRFVGAEQFPERARRRRQACRTDDYELYLHERIRSGISNVSQLCREIKEQGYSGSYIGVYSCVTRLLASLSETTPGQRRVRSPVRRSVEVPPSRTVAWWLQGHLRSTKLETIVPIVPPEAFLAVLFEQVPVLKEASGLARGFATLMRQRSADDLSVWLEQACQSHCNEIRQFAIGLQQDLSAVTNAVSLSWSNGQTEGQVNRLKMIKRQMYGRAKFDLLRARVMPRAKAV